MMVQRCMKTSKKRMYRWSSHGAGSVMGTPEQPLNAICLSFSQMLQICSFGMTLSQIHGRLNLVETTAQNAERL